VPFPASWPPRKSAGVRSLRVYKRGTSTAVFEDHAFIFAEIATANTLTPTPILLPGQEGVSVVGGTQTTGSSSPSGAGPVAAIDANPSLPVALQASPPPMIWCGALFVANDDAPGGNDLEFSFDGTAVHGRLRPGESRIYRDRYEAGIAIRGVPAGVAYRVEAW